MRNYAGTIKGLALVIYKNLGNSKKTSKTEKKIYSDIYNYFSLLFEEDDDDLFEKNFMELISHAVTEQFIISNLHPSDYDQYLDCRACYKFANNLRFELRWLVYVLRSFAKDISLFVEERKKYDDFILMNKYEDALQIVEKVEKKFGVSLWSAECKFFLSGKIEGNFEDIMNQNTSTVIGSIFRFYKLRNKETVTNSEYTYLVEKQISSLIQTINQKSPYIEFFAYALDPIGYIPTYETLVLLCYFINHVSLIDRYIFWTNLCEYALRLDKDDEIYLLIKTYIQKLEDINDDYLISLRFLYDDKENRKNKYTLKNELDKIKEEYIKGNILSAREKVITMLKNSPSNVEIVNFLVNINILLDKDAIEFKETNLGTLLNKLYVVYTYQENRYEDLDDIGKFAYCSSFSSWAVSIMNSCVYFCQIYNCDKYIAETLAYLQYLDIETVAAGLPADESAEFIDEKLDLNNEYVRFRKACCEKEYNVANKLCKINQICDLLYIYDDKNGLQEKIMHLGKIEGNDALFAVMRTKYCLNHIDLDEELEIALDVSTQLIISNIYTAYMIPLKKIISYIDQRKYSVKDNICIPILYYVYVNIFRKDRMDDLFLVCEAFFNSNNVLRPSKMDIYEERFKGKVIFFMKNVCNSKVIDTAVLDIRTPQDRDQERVEICNILCQIDSDNIEGYEKEIREITQKIMINKELKKIEENRICVNIDGIRENLINEYSNDFTRYKLYEEVSLYKWLAYLEDSKKVMLETSERILNSLVFHIRDAFVSSDEYGLDFYLSLNIRHGTLADELRGPFSKALLYAIKDANTDKYIIDSHWRKNCKESDLNIITQAISEFHIATEAIISKLKGRYIQIRTEEKETQGLFDYRLYSNDIMLISRRASTMEVFEDFLDYMISFMWNITEWNLQKIKDTLNTEILEDYNSAIANLKNKILQIETSSKKRELVNKINAAAVEIQAVLEKICSWFQRSKNSQNNDFELQFAFDMELQVVSTVHRDKIFVAKAKEDTISDKIPGEYLKNYSGIFYNLFNNIYKRACPNDEGEIEIRYILKYENGQTYIYLENDYDCSKNIETEKEKIERQKVALKSGEYKKIAKGEGGTGIPKICNIINSEIKHNININYDFIEDKNIFFIEISF